MSAIDVLVKECPYLEIQSVILQKEYLTRYLVRNRTANNQQYYVDILTFLNEENQPLDFSESLQPFFGNFQQSADSEGTTVLAPPFEGTTILNQGSEGTTLLSQDMFTDDLKDVNPWNIPGRVAGLNRNPVETCIKTIESLKKLSENEKNRLLRIFDYRVLHSDDKRESYVVILLEALPSVSMVHAQETKFESAVVRQMGSNICRALDSVMNITQTTLSITSDDIYVAMPGVLKLGNYVYSKDAMRGQRVAQMNSRNILYESPEEIRHQEADQRSLVYSVGMIMYEMGNGGFLPGSTKKTAQFSLMDIEQNVNYRINGTVVKLPQFVDSSLGNKIVKAISLNPLDRYGSLNEFYEAIVEQPEKMEELNASSRQTAVTASTNEPVQGYSNNGENWRKGVLDDSKKVIPGTDVAGSSINQMNEANAEQSFEHTGIESQKIGQRKKTPLVPILALMCVFMTSAAIFITAKVLKQQYHEKYVIPFEQAEAEKKAEENAIMDEQRRKENYYSDAVFTADVYKVLVLREKAYVTAPIVKYLDAGTKLHIIGDGEGPMVEVSCEDGSSGFVEKRYLAANGMKTIRVGTKDPELAEDNIYLIDRYDSAPVYTGAEENYSIISYLPAGSPIQILEWGEYFALMIDLQSGLIGYVPIGDVPINTRENLAIFMTADMFTTAGYYQEASYPLNSIDPVYLRKEESTYSEAVDMLVPGQWVSLISISDDGQVCHVMTQGSEPVSGYIKTELLYADSQEGTE